MQGGLGWKGAGGRGGQGVGGWGGAGVRGSFLAIRINLDRKCLNHSRAYSVTVFLLNLSYIN